MFYPFKPNDSFRYNEHRKFSFLSGGYMKALMIAQDYSCFYCGCRFQKKKAQHKFQASKDHFFPKSKGFYNLIGNMVWACCDCNSKKGDKWPDYSMVMKALQLYDSIGATLAVNHNSEKTTE